jgi:hypothetical protein
MLKPGDSYHYLTEVAYGEKGEDGRIRYANNPLNSSNTSLVRWALVSGLKLLKEGSFRDTIEQTDKGPLRKTEWFFDGASRAIFVTAEGREEIDFEEFKRRYDSHAWCLEHCHHPIAFMRFGDLALPELRDEVRKKTPDALIRRGNRSVTIPANLPQDKREKLLSYIK